MELRAATEAEIVGRDRLTHAAWGSRLTLDQYLERERVLAATPFAQERRACWVLATDDEIFASCETYRMDSTLRSEDQLLEGSTFGIASVFVEHGYRNKGYASDLLRSLLERLRQEERVQAAILFSEVGAGIYERAGFQARPSSTRIYQPATEASGAPVADAIEQAEVADLLAAPAPGGLAHTFSIRPNADQIAWHVERSRFYARTLRRKEVEPVGARAGRAWALWAPDYKNERLNILLFAPGLPDGTRAVIEEARRAAHACALSEVHAWENPDNADLPGGESVPREGTIPMIAPFAAGLRAEDWSDYERALWV